MNIITIGIDLTKNILAVYGIGEIVGGRQAITRVLHVFMCDGLDSH